MNEKCVLTISFARVYILEGIITMLFFAVVWCMLPDYPKSARTSSWLTQREQDFVEFHLLENAPKTHDKAFSKVEAVQSLKDVKLWSFMISQVRQ